MLWRLFLLIHTFKRKLLSRKGKFIAEGEIYAEGGNRTPYAGLFRAALYQ
jgi:hypothetical protein